MTSPVTKNAEAQTAEVKPADRTRSGRFSIGLSSSLKN